jgi:hypothetical protein
VAVRDLLPAEGLDWDALTADLKGNNILDSVWGLSSTVGDEISSRSAGFAQIWTPAWSSAGYPFLKRVWVGMPKIPSDILRCTFYLYPSEDDARAGTNLGGTGFLVSFPSEVAPGQSYTLAVSNWHVVCAHGCSVIRVNKIGGGIDIFDFSPDQWHYVEKGHDVAVAPLNVSQGVHDLKVVPCSMFLTEEVVAHFDVGAGENVFMAGRFIDHDGGSANKPALRFGNISMMPEPIKQLNGSRQPTYCVDMHSRTGFSGSPVFAYRTVGDDLTTGGGISIGGESHFLGLLGIHCSQFPEYWKVVQGITVPDEEARNLASDGQVVKGLSGMTCVAPAWAIVETVEKTQLKHMREVNEKVLIMRQALGLDPTFPADG